MSEPQYVPDSAHIPGSQHLALIGTGPLVAKLAEALVAAGHHVTVASAVPRNVGMPILDIPSGITEGTVEDAVSTADMVLMLNPPVASLKVARQVAALLKPGAVYADFNPGSPAMKKRLAELFGENSFAEGAFTNESALAVAVAGTGASAVAELFDGADLFVETVSSLPGDAAAREILRSVLDKALAAAVIDVLWAAESLGQKDWAYQQILATFEAASATTAMGYLSGTAQHLKRRQMEMMDVAETMRDAGYDSTLVAAIETNYSRILHGKRVPFSKIK